MSQDQQREFLFADGSNPLGDLPDPRAGFYGEVAQVWGLPLGRVVRVSLQRHDLTEASGRLELERAPDLPLNVREPLNLTVGRVAFLSTQVAAWSLID